jgi:hypothetical protein
VLLLFFEPQRGDLSQPRAPPWVKSQPILDCKP